MEKSELENKQIEELEDMITKQYQKYFEELEEYLKEKKEEELNKQKTEKNQQINN